MIPKSISEFERTKPRETNSLIEESLSRYTKSYEDLKLSKDRYTTPEYLYLIDLHVSILNDINKIQKAFLDGR